MNKYSESLLASMNAVSHSNIANQATTITIEAQITEVLDRGVGLYKVKYLENYFNVYSNNENTYNVDEQVYVLIPNGDFSKQKFIIGTTAPSANTLIPNSAQDEYIEISNNLIEDNFSDIIALCSFVPEEREIEILNTDLSKELSNYLEIFNTISFSFNVKTNLPKEQQVRGNYGLKLSLPIVKTNDSGEAVYTTKDIIFDTSNMSGNPYSFKDSATQNMYITFDNVTEKYDASRNPSLIAFVDNFPVNADDKPDDIWLSNLSLKAIEVLTLSQMTGYYLTVKSDSGNYFLTNSAATKTLKPYLKINGKDTSYRDCACYWFREDATVTPTSSEYNSIGGIGWACLNEKVAIINSNNEKVYSYVTNEYELKVQKESFYSVRYKCVIVYGSKEITGFITLTDLTQKLKVKVSTSAIDNTTARSGYTYVTCEVDLGNSGIDPKSLKYIWTRHNKNNDYIDDNFYNVEVNNAKIAENVYTTKIYFDASLIDSSNTIYCSVYSRTEEEYIDKKIVIVDEDGEPIFDENGELQYATYTTYNSKLIGTDGATIFTSADFTYHIVWENNDILYKYDSDGDSPFVADYDGPNSSRLSSTKPLRFRIFDKYGNEFTQTQYNTCVVTWTIPGPNYSMIETLETKGTQATYVDITERGKLELSYTIADVYNASKMNNTVLVKVQLADTVLTSSAALGFLKDGESGTNGTRYSAVISYNDGSGNYTLNQRDNHGVNHNAKIMYLASSNEEGIGSDEISADSPSRNWYIYNYEDGYGVFKKLDVFRPSFSVDVYKDGKKIQNINSAKVSWSWYDRAVTNPCFSITNANSSTTSIITDKKWSSNKDVFCNILQVKVQVTDAQEGTNAEQFIYAYYPIEISRVSNIGKFAEFGDGEKVTLKYDGIVPSLTGGFFSVLYSSDGKNPKYDSSSDFKCVDGLIGESEYIHYKYDWTSVEEDLPDTLKISKITNSEQIDEDVSSSLIDAGGVCKVRPVSTWMNGRTKNFVKVELKWDDTIASIYKEELDSRNYDYYIAKAWEDYYKDFSDEPFRKEKSNREDLKDVLSVYFKDGIKKSLDNSKGIVDLRLQAINITDELFNKLDNWKEQIDYHIIHDFVGSLSYVNRYDKTYAAVSTARAGLIEIADDPNNLLGDLKDLSRFSLEPSDSEKRELGDSLYNSLKPYIDDFDTTIKVYHDYCNKIYAIKDGAFENRESAENFWRFKENIRLFLEMFAGMATPKPVQSDETGQEIDKVSIVDDLWIDNYNSLVDEYNKSIQEDFTLEQLESIFNTLVDKLSFWSDDTPISVDDKVVAAASLTDEAIAWFDEHEAEAKVKVEQTESYRNILIYQTNVSQANIIHIRPILFRMNAYEMSNLNAWDGNKIYLDGDGEGSYILAPQMGAGYKNEYNQFTGMVMGIRNLNNGNKEDENQVGLYGYSKGTSSFELDAKTGSAKFGTTGNGQIIIEPGEHAKIYGGNYTKNTSKDELTNNGSGMEIDLTEPHINFGTGYFEVDSEGKLKATEATISGEISATLGSIGGWKIDKTKIYSNITESNGRLTLSSRTQDSFELDEKGNYVQLPDRDGKLEYRYMKNFYDLFGVAYDDYSFSWKMQIIDDEYGYDKVYDIEIGYVTGETAAPDSPKHFHANRNENIYKDYYFKVKINNLDFVILNGESNRYSKEINEETGEVNFVQDAQGEYLKFEDNIIYKNSLSDIDYPGADKLPGNDNYPGAGVNGNENFKKCKFYRADESFSFNTNIPVYCEFEKESGFKNIYPIERGTFVGGIWQKDLVNGDYYKIDINGTIHYSLTYHKNGDIIEHYPLGRFIKINDDYYFINKFYTPLKMSKYNILSSNLWIEFENDSKLYLAQKGTLIDGEIWSAVMPDRSWYRIVFNEEYYYTKAYSVIEGCGIYSHKHASYDKESEGFFLGSRGLSLGSNIRLSSDLYNPEFRISTNGYFLTSDVYLGSDGISLGRDNFSVDTNGTLISKEGAIGPFSYNYSGLRGRYFTLSDYGDMVIHEYSNIRRRNGDEVVWKSDIGGGGIGGTVRIEVVQEFPTYFDENTLYLKVGSVVPYLGVY